MAKRQREDTISCHVCTLPFDDEDGNTDLNHICRLTTCGHYGHDICMQKWLLTNPTCPICRHVDITCNHGSILTCHRKEVLMNIINYQYTEMTELKYEKQQLQDEIMALRTSIEEETISPIFFILGS